MSDLDNQLDAIRADLDRLDEKLVALINERARLAQRIGDVKANAGLTVYAPDRERAVLDRVAALNPGPLPQQALRTIYHELMSASLALERTPRIAVLGPPGSFSHLAARRRFGGSVEFESVSTIAAVFDEIERGHAEFGLVPVENSIIGGVGETPDALRDREVRVCGEVNLAVHLHLFGHGAIDAVGRVYSKPEVFAQCQRYLMETGLITRTVPVASTSAAAEQAAAEPDAAAIASELAGELFDLPRLAAFVEDDPNNATRFLILGTVQPKPTGADKTSIVFSVGHQPGRLAEVLQILSQSGINMTRIESRPDRRRRWSYFFFVDFEGHVATPGIDAAMRNTATRCSFWKVLGAYPRSDDVL